MIIWSLRSNTVENERKMDFDEKMIMKEKRRTSRTKGKRTYEKTKIRNSKPKHRNVKNIIYNPNFDYDNYDEYEEYEEY